MLRDVVIVGRTRPRSMPLAILTMKRELHGFVFLYMYVILFLRLWCSAWRPLGPPELRYDEATVHQGSGPVRMSNLFRAGTSDNGIS